LRRLLAVLLAVAATVGGCGLPDDDRPRPVAAEDAPIDLSPTTVSPVDPPAGEETVDVYFVDIEADRLRAVPRRVETITVQAAIDALLRGLDEEERVQLNNNIPQGVVVLPSTAVADGVLTLDLGPAGEGGIQSVQGPAQARAFAQLVYTATEVPGVTSVRFLVDGQPIEVPTDAESTGDPVSRANYASLAPVNG
jgi:spore germination protein GerM